MTDPTTALREVLALSNKERDAEENKDYGAANDLYADLQGAAVNLIRTHGPALLSALEDARRMDALQALVDENGELLLHNGKGAGSGFVGLGLANIGRTLRAAIDAAIAEGDQA